MSSTFYAEVHMAWESFFNFAQLDSRRVQLSAHSRAGARLVGPESTTVHCCALLFAMCIIFVDLATALNLN